MKTVNERNSLTLRVEFSDADDAPSAPATAHWRLDCVTSNKQLQDWTAFTPVAIYDELGNVSAIQSDISVDAALNAIQQDGNRREIKEFTVAAELDTAGEYSESLQYAVINRKR